MSFWAMEGAGAGVSTICLSLFTVIGTFRSQSLNHYSARGTSGSWLRHGCRGRSDSLLFFCARRGCGLSAGLGPAPRDLPGSPNLPASPPTGLTARAAPGTSQRTRSHMYALKLPRFKIYAETKLHLFSPLFSREKFHLQRTVNPS